MAKISGKYETIFIVNPKLEEAAATAVVDKFKSLVEANGRQIGRAEWGERGRGLGQAPSGVPDRGSDGGRLHAGSF